MRPETLFIMSIIKINYVKSNVVNVRMLSHAEKRPHQVTKTRLASDPVEEKNATTVIDECQRGLSQKPLPADKTKQFRGLTFKKLS